MWINVKHILSYVYIIQSPNTSPLTYHDHLPFVGKRMHREVPETLPCQPVCQPFCPPERYPHQALAPWSSIWSSAGSTVTLVTREFLSKASATTCRSMTWQGADQGGSVESVGHLLVPLSPHVDHRRSATSQPALRRTGASSGSLSLMDLFLLKAFARASLQRWHRQHLRRCKKWNLRKIWL